MDKIELKFISNYKYEGDILINGKVVGRVFPFDRRIYIDAPIKLTFEQWEKLLSNLKKEGK